MKRENRPAYAAANKEKIAAQNRASYLIRKAEGRIKKQDPAWYKEYYDKNQPKILSRMVDYSASRAEEVNAKRRAKYWENPEDARAKSREGYDPEYSREYKQKNRLRYLSNQKAYFKKRKSEDPAFKLGLNLRARTVVAMKKQQALKTGSITALIGCSGADLRSHVESQFTAGMTWENYGCGRDKWSLDHIVPMYRFNLSDPVEIAMACHYTNIQPMWFIENVKKGNKLNYKVAA